MQSVEADWRISLQMQPPRRRSAEKNAEKKLNYDSFFSAHSSAPRRLGGCILSPSPRRRRGFVMLMALAVLAIVGAAILALAAAMSFDGQRTMTRARDAQLDQMLLAGSADAIGRLSKNAAAQGDEWNVDLPPSLVEQNATLTTKVINATDSAEVRLTIRAAIENRSAEQIITLQRTGEKWRVVSAQIPRE